MKNKKEKIIITGGAGFIGGTLIRQLLKQKKFMVFNFDQLGYASDLSWTKDSKYDQSLHNFLKIDLRNKEILEKTVEEISPAMIINLAAESHVDRSIDDPSNFIESNIVGTFNLLEAARSYWGKLNETKKSSFKFIHISTDEVFGSLGSKGKFDESTKYAPTSPYSASKASSDHLVKSWHNTYGLPTIISNCSNNYGPYQFPEKLIPLCIIKAIKGEEIPLYGDGLNVRDWLHVEDHVEALLLISQIGKSGENYCIGGFGEKTNKEVQFKICSILDEFAPKDFPHSSLITKVKDRPGHDKRYAINSNKIKEELGWEPQIKFEDGLKQTVLWYLNHSEWWKSIMRHSGYSGERFGNKN